MGIAANYRKIAETKSLPSSIGFRSGSKVLKNAFSKLKQKIRINQNIEAIRRSKYSFNAHLCLR